MGGALPWPRLPCGCLPSHPPCHRIRSASSWIRQEVSNTQQASKAAQEQIPSQVLLLPSKRLKGSKGIPLPLKQGYSAAGGATHLHQNTLQCVEEEVFLQINNLNEKK